MRKQPLRARLLCESLGGCWFSHSRNISVHLGHRDDMWEKPLNLGDKIQTDLVFRALHYCASPVFSFIYLFIYFGFWIFFFLLKLKPPPSGLRLASSQWSGSKLAMSPKYASREMKS